MGKLLFTSTIFISLLLFHGHASALTVYDFALTNTSYASGNINLNSTVQSDIGSDYRVADWNDIVNYTNTGGNIQKLKQFENSMLTRNGASKYSGSRQYYIDWSDRPGMTPYNSFLSHSHVEQLHLGSWYVNQPILGVREGYTFDLEELDYQTASDVTSYWYEDNYSTDFVNPGDTFVASFLAGSFNIAASLLSNIPFSTPGPLFDQWVSEIEAKYMGNVRANTFGQVEMNTASPVVLYLDNINFDFFAGLSFDYETFNIAPNDLLTIRSGDETLYQLYGSEILSGGTISVPFTYLSDIGSLSIGLYSNEANHELSVDNIQFYDATSPATTSVAPVPEPSTFLLLGSGLAGLAFYRRNKNKC